MTFRPLTSTPTRRWWPVPCLLTVGTALALLTGASAPASATGGPAQRAATPTPSATTTASAPVGWITTADGLRRVAPLATAELQPSTAPSAVRIAIDVASRYQQMDGFGAALTESSAHLLMSLSPSARTAALRSLFDPQTGAGIHLLRLPLGASDFALSRYSYDDLPAGQTDPQLARFSLAHDDTEIVPVLQQALQINPALRVMGTPWSAPGWMKTSGSLIGGTLAPGSTDVYAQYLARTVQALRSRGVPLRFLTLQNEPGYSPGDYPGMRLSAAQESALAVALAPKLAAAGLGDVQLFGYDHNWDDTAYPTALLADPAASAVLSGTAFHCYAGKPGAQDAVHAAAPDKDVWFTECSGGSWAPSFAGNLGWNAGTLAVGATRAWSRSVLFWNLALDPAGGPHTGGCSGCRGVLTITPRTGKVVRNVEYDVLALAGRAVRAGATRIGSPTGLYGVQTVAYENPDGSRVLTAYNSWGSNQSLLIDDGTQRVGAPLPAGSVVTVRW